MKKVLGLDLGTSSIGWAIVNQAENQSEKSSIIRTGVRVNPLSSDEIGSFEKGKAITTNADRTLKRGARRNLQRYKLRRDNLLAILKRESWITDEDSLSECGYNSTHQTYALRAKAVSEEISLPEFARVLLMINKKRGYKSNRKAGGQEEGHLIDGMEVAKRLYNENITPGQMCFELLLDGKKNLPDFYRSDLAAELNRVWEKQKEYYPEILTSEFKDQISNKGRSSVNKIFFAKYGINSADNKGKERKLQSFKWRVEGLSEQLSKEVLAYVISDICGEITNSSGYLGEISDRSKKLVFSGKTVGEYLYENLVADKTFRAKNKVFYRQDYLDEFEKLWETQSRFHPELTPKLKSEIRDVVIFYQRRLKSQKGLISFCGFENRCRVTPRSSILFQEFKIWQILNNIEISGPGIDGVRHLTVDEMQCLAEELSIKEKMQIGDAFLTLFGTKKGYEANYKTLEGNHTINAFYKKYLEIVYASGHGEYDINKISYKEAEQIVGTVFEALGFNIAILHTGPELFNLWHLLYSYEDDSSATGDRSLVKKVGRICNMPDEYSRILTGIVFKDDYASLSNKAITRILPFLKDGNTYDIACLYAGYVHSKNSLTKEQIENKVLVDRLEVLPKNSLRNPVVEKILNQMVNVVNAVADEYGRPDEIHIEMSRSLKQNAKQREAATQAIADNTRETERITDILQKQFGLSYVRKTDVVRYRLYEELKDNGYKTLYSNTYVSREVLFSDEIDIEHIIPQALLFNDSYSNKTIEFKDTNREKDRDTASDYVAAKYGEQGYKDYVLRVEDLYKRGAISKTKRANLLMSKSEIPGDFVNRDLTCSQYIAKYAKEMLESYVKVVVPTSGAITERLRREWQLVDIMKEISLPKYRAAGKTFKTQDATGKETERIDDWTKRNDHRHHAMDALTIAFTTPSHIQCLNTLSSRNIDDHAVLLPAPMPLKELRVQFKENIETTLVSIKAKNKVTTRNINRTKCRNGYKETYALTPRGPLHKEQVYGLRRQYESYFVPVGAKLTVDIAQTIASQSERGIIMARLTEYGNDPKKAFSSKSNLEGFPDKVKCVRFKTVFSIRKNIDADLSIDKVMDSRVRDILKQRLAKYNGDKKKAFSNLDESPIWLNEEKRIKIKKVTIAESYDLCAIHDKRDKDGKLMLNSDGNTIPSDFVNLRNNHHIAIYEDDKGKLQESVVSFFEALNRITDGQDIVDSNYRKSEGWKFLFSMKINEMFVFPDESSGFNPEDVDLMESDNYRLISPHLFRVQKLSKGYYCFRHHLETTLVDDNKLKDITWKRITSINSLKGVVKVRINHIGQIVSVGEYD